MKFYKNPLWQWLGISLLLHVVTAYFSIGYHSADEHFQILEFLGYKWGITPKSVLAVEYAEKMRPWFQPWFYGFFVSLWRALGVNNPFVWATTIREVSALIGWGSVVGLALCAREWCRASFKGEHAERAFRLSLILLSLTWYLPALHARTSSENLSGSFFLIGLSILVLSLKKTQAFGKSWDLWAFLGGITLGLSFECRFQVGFMVFGFLAWLIFCARISWRAFLPVAIGLILSFALGRKIDAWAYGEWTLSPWHYVQYNLLRGEINRYGQAPWWDLFRMSFTETWPFLGLAVALLTPVAWLKFRKNPLTWSGVPFFLVHEAIAHKELRFFFPIASGAPALLALLAAKFWTPLHALWTRSRIFRGIGWFFVLNNMIALTILCFLPFSRTVQFYEGVWDNIPASDRDQRFQLVTDGRDPYEVLGTDTYFYRPRGLQVTRAPSLEILETMMAPAQAYATNSFWLYHGQAELPAERIVLKNRCKCVYRTLPAWINSLNFNGWLDHTNIWSLWKCDSRGA